MAIINLICEQCSAGIEIDDSQEYGYCKWCKTKTLIKNDTIIQQTTQNITKHVYGHEGKDTDELVADGNRLLSIGDEKKANFKFKNAINIDPSCWAAWLGYATTGGDKSGYISCVPAFVQAYNVATDESEEIATFNEMTKFLPDANLSIALIRAYEEAQPNRRHEMFNLVAGVIGCDESETAQLAIDLCPNDWRAWFAQAKIRQIRVRWSDRRLSPDAQEICNIFVHAYKLAKWESAESANVILAHVAKMSNDDTYKNFTRELNARIKREG